MCNIYKQLLHTHFIIATFISYESIAVWNRINFIGVKRSTYDLLWNILSNLKNSDFYKHARINKISEQILFIFGCHRITFQPKTMQISHFVNPFDGWQKICSQKYLWQHKYCIKGSSWLTICYMHHQDWSYIRSQKWPIIAVFYLFCITRYMLQIRKIALVKLK